MKILVLPSSTGLTLCSNGSHLMDRWCPMVDVYDVYDVDSRCMPCMMLDILDTLKINSKCANITYLCMGIGMYIKVVGGVCVWYTGCTRGGAGARMIPYFFPGQEKWCTLLWLVRKCRVFCPKMLAFLLGALLPSCIWAGPVTWARTRHLLPLLDDNTPSNPSYSDFVYRLKWKFFFSF